MSFAGDTMRLDYAENQGAILSFEHSMPEKWRGAVFSVAVAALSGLLILCLFLVSALRPLSVIGLSLTCGGISSNLFDRIAFGYVVDFLNVGWGGFRSGIFNVADAAIIAGLWLFVLSIVWNLRPRASRKPERFTHPGESA